MEIGTARSVVTLSPTPELSHYLPHFELRHIVEQALNEDLGRGDVTSDLLVPQDVRAEAALQARSGGVVAGLAIVGCVFELIDPAVTVEILVPEGSRVQPGQTLAIIKGAARSMLRGERVALNFVQRLSGIASLTMQYVEAVQGTQARIVDTRKTTPGLRSLEKYAVRAGGGHNHRRDLGDAMLIKDNHLIVIAARGLSLTQALESARASLPHTVKIEVEVDRVDQIPAVLAARADIILLDNMTPTQLVQAVKLIGGRALTEASGGITLHTVRAIAETGVDLISVGALTHSAPALDIGLDFSWE